MQVKKSKNSRHRCPLELKTSGPSKSHIFCVSAKEARWIQGFYLLHCETFFASRSLYNSCIAIFDYQNTERKFLFGHAFKFAVCLALGGGVLGSLCFQIGVRGKHELRNKAVLILASTPSFVSQLLCFCFVWSPGLLFRNS